MSKNILDDILTLPQVAESVGTSEQNIRELISNKRVPEYLYSYKVSKNKRRGIYIFLIEFVEYYEKNLRKRIN